MKATKRCSKTQQLCAEPGLRRNWLRRLLREMAYVSTAMGMEVPALDVIVSVVFPGGGAIMKLPMEHPSPEGGAMKHQRHLLRRCRCLAPLWCMLLLPSLGVAQQAPVYVTASFTDRNNLFIEDLSREEVQVLEDGQPRKLEFMAKDELPTVYGLLFSRAMFPETGDEIRRGGFNISSATTARDMAYELIDKHLRRHTLWIGAYEKDFQVVLESTTDGFEAKNSIQRLRGRGNPEDAFFYSGLFSSVSRMNERHEKRRVLIVFLDLLDAESLGKWKALKNLITSSNVELFLVSFASRLGGSRAGMQPSLSRGALKELGQATAGDAFFTVDSGDHPEDLVRRLFNQIRTLYTFGFTSNASPDRPAKLAITCSRPGSKAKHHPTVPVLP